MWNRLELGGSDRHGESLLPRARQAEEALRRSNEELERFGYRVAHDLTEPLRTIMAHTQLLEKRLGEHQDEAVTASMRFVVDAANRMKSFIDGLLGFSRVTHEGGQVGSVDFEALLLLAVEDLASAVQTSGAQITHDPLPRISAGVGFEQVFQNLIGNSIKYRREGVNPEIHISARAEGDSWIFSVRDNGIGIEPRYQSDVFQPFRRLHGRDIPGSGIGLATCKKIVEAHGGDIWVESQPGSGSAFFFRLPRAATCPSHASRTRKISCGQANGIVASEDYSLLPHNKPNYQNNPAISRQSHLPIVPGRKFRKRWKSWAESNDLCSPGVWGR